ncbi:hypothetical protein CDL12_03774 [Handroanthus impetiginosus]|uniref:Uncharacterized protein n=1 Tax=Handroanthus impetiginosus TaxID=429701 RepID=A0A2G9I1A1_9LAMI|nr:hypothetical protein CDL12_03774 [Handroanthus impetiginosus]
MDPNGVFRAYPVVRGVSTKANNNECRANLRTQAQLIVNCRPSMLLLVANDVPWNYLFILIGDHFGDGDMN